jgi:hypothetical protein
MRPSATAAVAISQQRKRKQAAGARELGDDKKGRASSSASAPDVTEARSGGDGPPAGIELTDVAKKQPQKQQPQQTQKAPKSVLDKIVAAIRALASPTGSSSVSISKYMQTTWA